MDHRERLGFFRRLFFSSTASRNGLENEAFMRHLTREARPKEAWDTPLQETRFLVVDTESTGFQPERDALLSIGAVEMNGVRIVADEVFHSLIRPEPFQPIPLHITELTGIRDEEVALAPRLQDVLLQFVQRAKGAVLVMHHAEHDMRFLNHAMWMKYNVRLSHHVIDTFDVARWLWESYHPFTLDQLLGMYDIAVAGRHTADGDAKMTAVLWQRMLEQAMQREVETLGELFEQLVIHKQRGQQR